MKTCHASSLLLIGILMAPAPAQAQPEFLKDNVSKIIHKIGVHANVSVREPVDGDLTKGTTYGGSVVLGGGRKPGWKYPCRSRPRTCYLNGPGGDRFGRLKSWAIVGGIGYGWNFGKLTTSVGLQTGYAFNSGTLEGNAAQAFGNNGPVSLEIGNAFLLRPKVSLEYFLTPKFTRADIGRLRRDAPEDHGHHAGRGDQRSLEREQLSRHGRDWFLSVQKVTDGANSLLRILRRPAGRGASTDAALRGSRTTEGRRRGAD